MIAASGGPGWTDIMTAFGTVGAVAVALFIALWSDWRTGQRLDRERDDADRRLRHEQEHSDAQLAEERRLADERLRAERDVAQWREQLAEAYAVQVVLAGGSTGDLGKRDRAPHRLAVIVVNRGRYTITNVEAQLRLGGSGNPSLVGFDSEQRLPGGDDLPPDLLGGLSVRLRAGVRADRLTPWDRGLRFDAAPVSAEDLQGAYPVVRWTDRWGGRWEHRLGEVRPAGLFEEWMP